jgi:hypothetical protein
MIGFIDTLYIHKSELQVIQRYIWFTHCAVHRCTHTRILSSLVVSWQRIYQVWLSLHITHDVFFSQPNSFLAIILQLPTSKIRLNSIPSSYPSRLASRNSTLHTRLLFYTRPRLLTASFYNLSARNHGKYSLCCWQGVFTAPLPSDRRPIVARVDMRENLFTESFPSNGYTCHNKLCRVFPKAWFELWQWRIKSRGNYFSKTVISMKTRAYRLNWVHLDSLRRYWTA